MIELCDITLDKKEEINEYFDFYKGMASELSFSTLYMWRKSYNMKYAIANDVLCTSSCHGCEPRCFSFPIGFIDKNGNNKDVKQTVDEIITWCQANNQKTVLRFLNKHDLKKLNDAYPEMFETSEDRDGFDYVYKIDDLVNLSGKRYHSKKNHVNKFTKLYPDFEYCSLGINNADECLSLFNTWRGNKDDEPDGLDDEKEAIKDLLTNLDTLNVIGGGIRVNGQLAAFSFGEALNDNTVLVHLEHADNNFQGAFAMINREFLKNQWSSFTYVNREEDMGIPGMRKAKKSYHPTMMIKKYYATLK